MTLTSAAVVFLTSLLALPFSYLLNSVSQHKDQSLIVMSGLAAFCFIVLTPWLVLSYRLQQRVHSFYYVLSLLTYSSVMSLIVALGNDGLIAEFLGCYLREGEPYLKTAHGTMISYWDGIAHYAMYLMILAAVSWNQSFHDVGLYWAGSFGYSKLVLAIKILIGKDGLKWAFFLQVPYFIICLLVSLKFFEKKFEETQVTRENISEQKSKTHTPRIWRRPMDLCLLLYFMFATVITIIRFSAGMQGNMAMVSKYRGAIEPYLADPSLYPRAQLMVQALYFIPYYGLHMYSLVYPGQSWILPWCLVFAGASAQAQFSLMGASFHYRTPYMYRLPQTLLARCMFWCINGLQLMMPQLAAYSCVSSPSLYLTPAPTSPSGLANGCGLLPDTSGLNSRRGSTHSNHSLALKKFD